MLIAKNTQYNRKLDLIDKRGSVLFAKDGLVYFSMEIQPGVQKIFKSDEHLFPRQFDDDGESLVHGWSEAEMKTIIKNAKSYPF
jgi:hypothetical protein